MKFGEFKEGLLRGKPIDQINKVFEKTGWEAGIGHGSFFWKKGKIGFAVHSIANGVVNWEHYNTLSGSRKVIENGDTSLPEVLKYIKTFVHED